MNKHFSRLFYILVFIVSMIILGVVFIQKVNINLLSYDDYLSKLKIEYPLNTIDSTTFDMQKSCTAITEEEPFKKTITKALLFVKTKIDRDLYYESKEYLQGGVVYRMLEDNVNFPYSAYYSKKTIYLFDNLFSYGCLEDVVSTLTHELIHVIQDSRFKKSQFQLGERNLNAEGLEKVLSEIEADSYQLYVSKKLKLVGKLHLLKIEKVINKRRLEYNQLMREKLDIQE